MFKKFVLILVFLFILTGCNIYVINYDSVNSIIETVLYKEKEITNFSFEGYSFYLPQGNKIVDKNDYNIKIKDNRYYYYLYVDTIAYHYKVTNNVELDSNHFYTMKLDNTKTVGYIDITEYNDKYFIVQSLDEIISQYNKGTLDGGSDNNKNFYKKLIFELTSIGTKEAVFISGLCDDIIENIDVSKFIESIKKLLLP